MTTVVAALDRIAREVSVSKPSNWITETQDTYCEIRDDFLLEVVDDLHKRVDWAAPIGKQVLIAGNGDESYDLPADFKRLQRSKFSIYETNNVRRLCVAVTTVGEWTHLKAVGSGMGERFYRVSGYEGSYEISFYPALSAGESITVSYVSDVWMHHSGIPGNAFNTLDDELIFPRRLLETGVIWRWRRRKGQEYMDLEGEYERWVATLSNEAKGVTKINFGDRSAGSFKDLHVPDFIPSS